MSNTDGLVAAITTLSPITKGREAPLRQLLAGFRGDASPFRRVPRTRFARFVIVPATWPEKGGGPPLRTEYLLWTSTFDGPVATYLEDLFPRGDDRLLRVWRECVGCGSTRDETIDYVRRSEVPVEMFLAFHTQNSGGEIEHALNVQAALRTLADNPPVAKNVYDRTMAGFRA